MKNRISFHNKTFRKVICNLSILMVFLSCYAIISYKYSFSLGTAVESREVKNYVFLSDLNYITDNNWSYNGWGGHDIQVDKNQEEGILSLLINGEKRLFSRGLSVHAKGQVTFDISQYSTDFPRFIAYIGVDASRGSNGSIWFKITASRDGSTWDSLINKSDILTGSSDAVNVDIDVTGYKYLCIYIDPNGSNAADHGTIANARLVTEDFTSNYDDVTYDKIHKINYYDEILAAKDFQYNYENNYRLILEREFVRKIDFWNIQYLAEINPDVVALMDWILGDNRILEDIIEVGEISNSTVFMNTMASIYHQYKNEFKKEKGPVYQKMMIGLAAAYSTDAIASPLGFGLKGKAYEPLERFTLVKQLFDNDQFTHTDWIQNYHVELMRMMMQDGLRNDELLWLNGFSHTKPNPFNHYAYIAYRLGPNYNQPEYFDINNKEKYDTKYHLSEFGVPFADGKTQRYWMAMEYGGICWNISRIGQSIYKINGIPSVGIYQPQHEAYLVYGVNSNGEGIWGMNYNVFGWGKSSTKWGGGNRYRLLFDWGNKYFTDQSVSGSKGGTSSGYIILGQAALNHYEEFKESYYYNLLANSYTSNSVKLNIYNRALESFNLNLDSYDYKIKIYKDMGDAVTSTMWYALANDIIDAYTLYPQALYDLLNQIKPYLEGGQKVEIDLKERTALLKAASAPSESIQKNEIQSIANQLLGKAQAQIATFSFDGENAGKIIVDPQYTINYSYSLDGGQTFSGRRSELISTLTSSEIASITPENDIIISMDGTPITYTIPINKGTLSSTLYGNDLENRVVGVNLTYEWRNSESAAWTSYRDASPDNTGNKTLQVRVGYTGNNTPSDIGTFIFTEDNQPNTRKYVPVSHLSIHAVSSEATSNQGSAAFAIDANYNTRWHSAWNGSDTERFIVIKLDRPINLSAIEFVPAGGGNGKIIDGTIYGSDDGENWQELVKQTDMRFPNNTDTVVQAIEHTKTFEISEPKQVQYVKIVANRATNGNWFAARAFNFYQDITKEVHPTAGVAYSKTDPTTENIVARLVNPSSPITITNNGGSDTYTFIDNGEFTFEFVDDFGVRGSVKAKVDWIDRIPPIATIEYSTISPVNHSVFATLKPSEDVVVTNNGDFHIDHNGNVLDQDGNILPGYTIDDDNNIRDSGGNIISNVDPFKYEFIANGEFIFQFVDRAGNRGSATAKVDWIDTEPPVASLIYDKSVLTNQNVTVSIDFNENAIVTNNNGSRTYTFAENGEFTFEFRDDAGNTDHITARVNWIDKIAPTAELKYEKQGNKVIVRVVNPSKEITFQEGIGVYEFTKNGSYDIVFYDRAGNINKLTAVIQNLSQDTDNNSSGNRPSVSPGPSNSAKPTTNPGGNNLGNGDGSTNPTNKDYKKFFVKNVRVEIPVDVISEGVKLNISSFDLHSSLTDKFGADSEYFDIHLLDSNYAKIDVDTSSLIKISIYLKKTKDFLGIYEITNNNVVKEIEYEKNGDSIEFVTKKLGRYVISYEEPEIVYSEESIPKKTKYENPLLIISIIGIVIVVLDLIFYFVRKRIKKKKEQIEEIL